jgi:PDDEXK-like domain of unknown function (DUF3799)
LAIRSLDGSYRYRYSRRMVMNGRLTYVPGTAGGGAGFDATEPRIAPRRDPGSVDEVPAGPGVDEVGPGSLRGALPHGLHRGIEHDAYHVRVLGMASNTALSRLVQSPAHYRAWLAGHDKDTPARAFGRGMHCALTEPGCFARTYAVEPDFGDCRANSATGTTKEEGAANKRARDLWRLEHAGAELVAANDFEAMQGMSAAVRRHPTVGRLLESCEAELTARWLDTETDVECKARADLYSKKFRTIVDIKTTEDARPHAFARSVALYGYHRQEAFYRQGFAACGADVERFVFVAVEKTVPYGVRAYMLDAEGLEKGAEAVRRGLRTLALCLTTGQWPAYTDEIEELSLPRWAA